LIFNIRKPEFKKPKLQSGWRLKVGGGYNHQFFDNENLDYLEEKENLWKEYQKKIETGERIDDEDVPEEFTEEDESYREDLLTKGFSKWNKKDFTRFLRACEIYGLNDYENISKSMRTKSPEEVEEYVEVFKEKVDDLPGGQRIMAKINKYESEKNKIIEYHSILDDLFNDLSQTHNDIYTNLKIPYKAKIKQTPDL
jgi:uncharacterized short protein YbdD (DUF466 family)